MKIVVDDLMTNYDRQGHGKILLMVHGWADNYNTFDGLTGVLNANYDILRLDLPGFGLTEAPKEVWTLDNYAQFIYDFLNKLEVTTVYGVVGHSNGGAVAIRAIALHKLQPEKLVLLASSGVRDTAQARRFILKIIAKTGKVITFWMPRSIRKALQRKLYGTVGSDMLVAPHLQETFKITVRQDVQEDATKISIPTLLIYGDQDHATPADQVGTRLHSKFSDSRLAIIHNADHFVHKAEPDKVIKTMQDFLK